MRLEDHVQAGDRHKHVAGLNRLVGFQLSPLEKWISNGNTDINKTYYLHIVLLIDVN